MTTTALDELLDLERAAWEALCTSGDAATKYYEDRLAHEVLMLFPGPMVISDRRQVVSSMQDADWSSYDMRDERVLPLGDGAAVLAYEVVARRPGAPDYHALLNSTYVREDGGWKLALHQQTPV
jgi:hypothetical protein